MSEPAVDGEEVVVPQPSATETVEEEDAEQVVDGEATEESRPEEVEIEVQQDVEEKEESAPEDLKVELQPEIEEGESQSPEEQQQPSQDEREDPEKAMDDSQDTVQMPISDTPERALEDEEMPSMVTISSTSRIDESETYNKQDETETYNKQDETETYNKQDETETYNKQDEDPKFDEVEKYSPQPVVAQQKDSDSDSVCVIESDDDDEEEDQNNYDEEEEIPNDRRRVRYNDDDDEGETSYDDEYDGSSSYDSEDVDDEERYNDKHDRRYQRNDRRDIDEEVEDDDEDEEDGENEDEFMDDRDFGGGGSDDAILRPNTNGLSKQQKERSSSLQDLSLIQGPSPKSRQNVNPFSQKAIFERNQGKGKYAHVPSKVKKYIDDGAEQRRMSIERRKKSIDEIRQKSEEPTEIQIQRSEEIAMACQTIKNYAEKTLKEVAECEENDKMIFLQQGVENGEISLIPRQLMSSHTVETANKANEMEIDLIDEDDEKRPTFNGTLPKENQNNFVTERKGIMRREDGPPKSSIFNGEDPLAFQQPIDNLRTLSYDEYMKGPVSTLNEVVVNRIDISEVQSIVMQEAEIEDDSGLRIESVVSNYSSEKVIEDFQNRKTPPMMVHQSTETFYQENPELHSLRVQLNQRNQQFENLREAYQKNMSDSLAMRMELENLRKSVAHYQEQQRSPRVETKVSAVQTEKPSVSRDMPLIDLDGNDARLGVSQVSTQWSDSTGSVTAISMDPPNVTNALNSDESAQPKTPMPKRNALSRAFMTSTKILQTLSGITHGKTKVDKFTKPAKVQEADKSSKLGPPNSKKRKASDAMDDSTQPTKIPKSNDREGLEPTTPESQFVNPNTMEQESAEKKDDERRADEASSDDDVKVYVYPEDEEGHEHSFLIQAKEVSDNPKPGVRECGPYLLGNVEVYMTEVNGTINIWGKELSQTSQATTEVTDLDASARSRDLRQNLRWQSTPRIFNKHEQQASASTSKKSRLLPRYLQPPSRQEPHQCEHNQRLSWPSCHEHQHHQHQHSCCGNASPVVPAASCGCVHEQQRTPAKSCCMTKSMPNMNQNCCCSGHVKPLARRHSFNPTDEEDSDADDDANRTLLADDCSPHSFSKGKAMHQHAAAEPRRSSGGSSNDPSSMCENESDPLIAARHVLDGMEGPEKKRKKKVRGILMDLLRKGCAGDCRTNPLDKTNLHHTTSIYEPSTSAQHRAPCLPSQPSHSHRPNERCSSCCKPPDKTSQIEAQMERFREEMDKLRSQSDTLAGMIQALKNADVID